MTRREFVAACGALGAGARFGASKMHVVCYDDPLPSGPVDGIFLAGPSISAKAGEHAPWRLEALGLLQARGYGRTVVLPEFRAGGFRHDPFDDGRPSTTPRLKRASERILDWETAWIDACAVLLVWMPFAMGPEDSLDSRPGFSTRFEASRAIAQRRKSLALGMPPGALSGGQALYHAHRAGYRVHETLAQTVDAALALLGA